MAGGSGCPPGRLRTNSSINRRVMLRGFFVFLVTLFGWISALAVRYSRLTAP